VRPLEFLLGSLRGCFDGFPDKRRGANTTYGMADIGMAAFSVFFMQSPSFLAHQRHFAEAHGRSNCASLFGIAKIPSDNHIRDMLDPASPALLQPAFAETVEQLKQINGGLDVFRRLDGHVLIALDGTEYHCSRKIHCAHCSTRARGNGVTEFYHGMLAATLVAPAMTRSSRWNRRSSSRRTGRGSRTAKTGRPSAGWQRMASVTRPSIRSTSATICSPASRFARRCWTSAGTSSLSASRHRIR
jgi:hypothetical protein